jgi:hypothetical protein
VQAIEHVQALGGEARVGQRAEDELPRGPPLRLPVQTIFR